MAAIFVLQQRPSRSNYYRQDYGVAKVKCRQNRLSILQHYGKGELVLSMYSVLNGRGLMKSVSNTECTEGERR